MANLITLCQIQGIRIKVGNICLANWLSVTLLINSVVWKQKFAISIPSGYFLSLSKVLTRRRSIPTYLSSSTSFVNVVRCQVSLEPLLSDWILYGSVVDLFFFVSKISVSKKNQATCTILVLDTQWWQFIILKCKTWGARINTLRSYAKKLQLFSKLWWLTWKSGVSIVKKTRKKET